MGNMLLQIKIMPTAPETNLEEIKTEVKTKTEELGGILNKTKEQDIAFGLIAIIATIIWPEEKSTDELENSLAKIENVSSVQTIDMRRVFG